MKLNFNRWIIPIAFANIYIIWGLTFVAVTFGLLGFPPFILSGLRFIIAGIVIITYLNYKGEKINCLKSWKKNSITGILILTGGTGLVGWGEQYISAPEAAIAIATGPFWFIAIDKKNWKKYLSDKWIPIGLAIGFVGLIMFLNGSFSTHHTIDNHPYSTRIIAFAVLALSSIFWVVGALYSKNNPAQQSTFMNISQQLISAGVASLVIALISGEFLIFNIFEAPFQAWGGLLFLIFFGSIIAYISYIWLLTVRDAALVSTHTYINPIVTVIAGYFLSNQKINSSQFVGLIIILLGVLLTNCTKYFKISKRSKSKIRKRYRHFIKLQPIMALKKS